jgi:two-component system NtrC family sensor kinase
MTGIKAKLTSLLTFRDQYKNLGVKLFVIYGAIAALPLACIVSIGYFWLYSISWEDFHQRLQKQTEDVSQSLDFFLREKVSGLRLVSSLARPEVVTDDAALQGVLQLMKQEFAEIVDVGVIDSRGTQIAYAGPYNLKGRSYSDHDWFHEVSVRDTYISEVFMGYRKIPHFAIAVKKLIRGGASYYIWRVTIDVEALNKRIHSVSLPEKDDVFLVNSQGIIQTASRLSGSVLQPSFVTPGMLPLRYTTAEIRTIPHQKKTIGYMYLRNTPWILVMTTARQTHDMIVDFLRRDFSLISLSVLLILIGVVANYFMAQMVVSWIETSDKVKEEALRQTEHADKLASIGRLAAGVAHEINNPLAIINEKAGLMRDLVKRAPDFAYQDKFNAVVEGILKSVDRCRTITHRLLGFARQMDVTPEILDLNTLLRDVIGFLEREMTYRGIHLELELDEDLPAIESDRGQLQQVFLNIVNNGLDAVKDGGHIGVRTSRKDAHTISVAIRDDGHGIPPDTLERIFEPFFTTKGKGKGTGLGLSITYGIVKKLGGDIRVESELGKGTTFIVELPTRGFVAEEGGE